MIRRSLKSLRETSNRFLINSMVSNLYKNPLKTLSRFSRWVNSSELRNKSITLSSPLSSDDTSRGGRWPIFICSGSLAFALLWEITLLSSFASLWTFLRDGWKDFLMTTFSTWLLITSLKRSKKPSSLG